MRTKPTLWLAVLCLALLCTACRRPSRTARDEALRQMNLRAYQQRYRNVAETERLAQQVLDSTGGRDEMARLNLAFVAYQRMDYEGAAQLMRQLKADTRNQVYLLCGDVLIMKIVQRTGQYAVFFQSMHDAQRRVRRIRNEMDDLNAQEKQMYLYACSELNIVASTYYYYQGQDSLSVAYIREVEQNYLSVADTVQWIYYNYMMGSGGMVSGAPQEVTLSEFDYLMRTYNQSHSYGYLYFEANALQSMAQMAAKHYDILSRFRPEELLLLETRFGSQGADSLSLSLCAGAIDCFRRYKDMFQTACSHRTMGELLFGQGRYEEAVDQYALALQCINRHHTTYYHTTDTLLLCDTVQLDQSTEARWLLSDEVLTVPEWVGGIRQQISKAYSAMGMKWASDYNRNAYLDIQMHTNQNEELEQRSRELLRESRSMRNRAIASVALFVLLIWLLFVYRKRATLRVDELTQRLNALQSGQLVPPEVARLDEQQEELDEQLAVTRLQLEKSKQHNVVSRARVSLVHAIVPYLDRIAGEVVRMKREGHVRPERREYILELVAQISQLNEVLTEWIRVRRGQLSLNIHTVDLGDLFKIVGEGSFAFEQKGVRLDVQPTSLQVKADEALTLFMINTLADNARKFTPRGGNVTISAAEGDEYVEVSVSDTGVGLSEHDLETLNHSGVYDPATLGAGHSGQKGSGFGLANCRGIIETYKKQSDLFRNCLFGVRNNAGLGCTFFFRLPRVAGVLCAFLLLMGHGSEARSATSDAMALYDSLYQCNIEGRYAQAVEFGRQALACDGLSDSLQLGISNEMALSALALNDWQLYAQSDSMYTQLQKKLNRDPLLPVYVQQMETYHQNGRLMLLLQVLLFAAVLWYVYRLAVNRRLAAGNALNREIRQTIARLVDERQQRLEQTADRKQRNAYEQNRIYVQNQVLSNCLSTIKHESMYYPSRIETLARQMTDDDIVRLDETVNYYRHIYEILCRQADDQVARPGFRRETMPVVSLVNTLESALHRQGFSVEVEGDLLSQSVLGDTVLLDFFCQQLALGLTGSASRCKIGVESADSFVRFTLFLEGTDWDGEQLEQLFNPATDRLPFYVARQVIREHDTYSGNPGLRLLAQSAEGGVEILFTLLKSNHKA